MNQKPTIETLSAYIDGELDPEEMQAVEEALEKDQAAADELARLMVLNEMLTGAYDDALKGPIPLRAAQPLQQQTQSGAKVLPNEPKGGLSRHHARHFYAIAASFVVAVLAFPAGFFTSEKLHDAEMAKIERELQADRTVMASALSEALEKRLSGDPVNWHNSETGSRGHVTPIRTFQNSDGSWCREYREEANVLGEAEVRRAIACRSDSGEWQNRLLALGNS
jgi:hypothetical protein